MPGRTGVRLDDQQRERVRACLAQARASLIEPFDEFVTRIEISIDHLRAAKPEGTFREAHDALREIWLLSHDDDPSPALLRAHVKSLPTEALEGVGRRATAVLPRLFPGQKFEGDIFESPACLIAKFLAWAARAKGSELVTALRVLSADGACWVPGRSRGSGTRSAPRLEPRALGEIRGSHEPKPEGGRPSEASYQSLVMHLAVDWLRGTGSPPSPGRSDSAGFGALVYAVFEWLYVPKLGTQDVIDAEIETAAEKANYALRRYWAEARRATARSSPSVTSSRFCVDCHWMLRPSANPDDFFCRRLNLACMTGRKAAQACGPEGKLFEPSA